MVRESKVAMLLLSTSLAASTLLPPVARAEAASEAADAAAEPGELQ